MLVPFYFVLQMRSTQITLTLFFAAIASSLAWFVQPSTYWRDGAEFILSSVFLDISHPPGAPLYAQLVHPLTWLPVGPLAARVHLGNTLIIVLLCCQVSMILRRLECTPILSLLAALWLLLLPGVMHQALTAEVYALSAVCILLMLHLLIIFHSSRDRRLLLAVAFIAGIGSGVHLIVALSGLILTIATLLIYRSEIIRLTPSVLLCGLLGLSVWVYLPARAGAHPPLNTGSPATLERFINQVSDARDVMLRPQGGLESFHLSVGQIESDLSRFAAHSGWIFVGIAACGALLLLFKQPRSGALLILMLTLVAAIFAGWDFAPFAIISSIACITAFWTLSELPRWPARVGLGILMLAGVSRSNLSLAYELSDYSRPVEGVLPIFRSAARDNLTTSTALIEQSHYLVTYAQTVEGIRPDVMLLYQPALEWPQYFAPHINRASGKPYQSLQEFLFTRRIGEQILFEPSVFTTKMLAQVARCDAHGLWSVERPKQSEIPATCVADLLARLQPDSAHSSELAADEQHYRETITLPSAQLFIDAHQPMFASDLLTRLCEKFSCSPVAKSASRISYETKSSETNP